MKVSVITPVFNKSAVTNNFIDQNYRLFSDSEDIEFIIIDNGSTDNTAKMLQEWSKKFKQLKIITFRQNLGFSGGNNAGVNFSKNELLIFLSNDVLIRQNYIEPFLEAIKIEGIENLFGAHMLSVDTGWNTFLKNNKVITIPYLEGWCVVCHRDIFSEIGYWDERYFPCDYEDIDLSYTAMLKGIDLIAVNVPITHLGGKTAVQLDRTKITLENREKFVKKWDLSILGS